MMKDAGEFTYNYLPHAAHTGNGTGWDLEEIDITTDDRSTISVPPGYEWHSGYRDKVGRQHWIYYRRVPFAGSRCERCEGGN